MYIFPAYADVCVPSSNRTLKVVGVASDDTLNARSGFSTNYPVLFELAPNASGIRYLGEKKYKDMSDRDNASLYIVTVTGDKKTSKIEKVK